MDKLTKYVKAEMSKAYLEQQRPRILTAGGIYIWDATETTILAGPFDSVQHAQDAKSKALDRAIK